MTIRVEFSDNNKKEIEHIVNKNLNRILLNTRHVGYRKCYDWQDKVSETYLRNALKSDVPISEEANLVNFSNLNITNKMMHVVQNQYPDNDIQVSGFFHYPDTGYMSWHTNSDVPCKRLYITWAKEGGKSFFRYYENETVVTDCDDEGLTVRLFDIKETPPHLWHCVGSQTDRISFGFRIYDSYNEQ